MLIIARKKNEKVIIAGNIEILVTSVQGGVVRLGITTPPGVPVDREEIHLRKYPKTAHPEKQKQYDT